jgi:subtilase family serine protease
VRDNEFLHQPRERLLFQHVGSDRFLKGFVVIESPLELDVVAVYTAAGREGFVQTLHTERVMPRRIEVGLPDLVPVPDAQGSFCKREDGTLIVTVRNQGSAGAGPSTTRVDFGAHGTIDLPTPALAAGAAVDLRFPIPPGCFDPDCEFRIIVDVTNVVVESDEGNNFASGVCLG